MVDVKVDKDTVMCISISERPSNFGTTLFNKMFCKMRMNFCYKAFCIRDLVGAIEGIRAFGIRGCGVSMPFKEDVMKYLDLVDPLAERIGAVNTIVNEEGRLIGYNTDYCGAVEAIKEKYDVLGKKVVVIGAGGVSKAIIVALKNMNAGNIIVINRTDDKAKALAERFGIGFIYWDKLSEIDGDLLVNATSVGMAPKQDEMIVDIEVIGRFKAVMDVVAVPIKTKMIGVAESLGKIIIPGYRMVLFQGMRQFEFYTDKKPILNQWEKNLLEMI